MRVKLNSQDFRNQCRRFAAAAGVEFRDVLRVEMALWGEDLAKRTGYVPRGSLSASGSGGPSLARAITNDLMSAFRVVPGDVKRTRGRKVEIEQHYRQSRDAKTGRASDRGGVRPVISGKEMMTLARKIFRHAGTVRAGWIHMIRFFRGVPPAAWITRNEGRASGSAINAVRPDGKGYMEGTNRVAWARRMCSPNMMAFTAKSRDRHMKHLLQLRTDKTIEAFNRMYAKRAA